LEHAKAIGLAGDDEAAEGVGSAAAASPATNNSAPSSTTAVKEPVELAQYRRTRRAQ
jgi:hypothetical protein